MPFVKSKSVKDLQFLEYETLQKLKKKSSKGIKLESKLSWETGYPNEKVYPIHYAGAKAGRDGLTWLLELPGQPEDHANMLTDSGLTPLMFAAKFGNVGAINVLANHGASIDAFDNNGFTALHHACKNSKFQCVELLLEYLADTTMRDNNCRTPRDIAENENKKGILKLLDKNKKNDDFHVLVKSISDYKENNNQEMNKLKNDTMRNTKQIEELQEHMSTMSMSSRCTRCSDWLDETKSIDSNNTLDSGAGTLELRRRSHGYHFDEARYIRENYDVLRRDLRHTDNIVAVLYSAGFVDAEFKNEVLRELSAVAKNEKLLDNIIRGSKELFRTFLNAMNLNDFGQRHLIKLLVGDRQSVNESQGDLYVGRAHAPISLPEGINQADNSHSDSTVPKMSGSVIENPHSNKPSYPENASKFIYPNYPKEPVRQQKVSPDSSSTDRPQATVPRKPYNSATAKHMLQQCQYTEKTVPKVRYPNSYQQSYPENGSQEQFRNDNYTKEPVSRETMPTNSSYSEWQQPTAFQRVPLGAKSNIHTQQNAQRFEPPYIKPKPNITKQAHDTAEGRSNPPGYTPQTYYSETAEMMPKPEPVDVRVKVHTRTNVHQQPEPPTTKPKPSLTKKAHNTANAGTNHKIYPEVSKSYSMPVQSRKEGSSGGVRQKANGCFKTPTEPLYGNISDLTGARVQRSRDKWPDLMQQRISYFNKNKYN